MSTCKAVKNAVELSGMRRCHVRDAVALAEFFTWMHARFDENPGRRDITEIVAADKLEAFRRCVCVCKRERERERERSHTHTHTHTHT